MNPQIRVGALVKMRLGYSEPGILLELIWNHPLEDLDDVVFSDQPPKWARILWADEGMGLEKVRDLEVVA